MIFLLEIYSLQNKSSRGCRITRQDSVLGGGGRPEQARAQAPLAGGQQVGVHAGGAAGLLVADVGAQRQDALDGRVVHPAGLGLGQVVGQVRADHHQGVRAPQEGKLGRCFLNFLRGMNNISWITNRKIRFNVYKLKVSSHNIKCERIVSYCPYVHMGFISFKFLFCHF